jgi:hypothetical protein
MAASPYRTARIPRADAGDAGQQDEDLERRRRRQERRHEHDQHAVPVERAHRPVDVAAREPPAKERLSPFAPERIQQKAACERSQRCRCRIDDHQIGTAGHHPHDEEIGDFREREERRVEEGYGVEPRRAKRQGHSADPVGESIQET